MDTENFYSMYENSKQHAKAIDALCDACPVKKLCHSTGEENKEHGTWGGIYWNGKGKPDKRYNR